MKELTTVLIWVALVGIVFVVLWRRGHLARLATYVQQTREELKKCTWPAWEELKGSTVVVIVSVLLLGAFTVFADLIFTVLAQWLT